MKNRSQIEEQNNIINSPELPEIEKELSRVQHQSRLGQVFRTTVYALIIVAAVSLLIATLFLPVLRIFGNTMMTTLKEGDIVVCMKEKNVEQGDVIAFYYNNKILVKRVIATGGDSVDMRSNGVIHVNGDILKEPYLKNGTAYGECDISFPYLVPEDKVFVMGDNRKESIDSRDSLVGCVDKEQIVGQVFLRVWPINRVKIIK